MSGAAAGFNADADSDAAENGLEWATGTDPTNAQTFSCLAISSTRSNAVIGFPRNTNATDVIFTLLRSTNLTNTGVWTAIAQRYRRRVDAFLHSVWLCRRKHLRPQPCQPQRSEAEAQCRHKQNCERKIGI